MNIVWSDIAWNDYLYWQNEDRKTLKKINELIKDIERNGYKCIGKPEPLKGNLSGYWSVRIDKANIIVIIQHKSFYSFQYFFDSSDSLLIPNSLYMKSSLSSNISATITLLS